MADGDAITDVIDLSGNGKGVALNIFPLVGNPVVYTNRAVFPIVGGTRNTYVANDTEKMYRWDDTLLDYIEISPTDPSSSAAVLFATSRAELAAINPVAFPEIFLVDDERADLFVFVGTDLSAEVTIDTQQGIYVPPLSDTTGNSGAWKRVTDVLTPEMFGAVGDAVTDDYAAFTALAAYTSSIGSAQISLGKGKTYYIGQYRTALNGIAPIQFVDCIGLTIEGNGAKLDFKGDFDRDVLTTTTGIGVQITNCVGVKISNLELDGNNEQTTNTSGSNENNNAVGLNLRSSWDVELLNIHAHNFATDGIACREGGAEVSPGVNKACRRISLFNCRSEYNSRCAIAPIGVRGLIADNCSFSFTARHGGTYGEGSIGHAPKCAFDIEPTSNATYSGDQDVDTGDITFRRCRFEDNLGGDWRTNADTVTDGLTIEDCTLISTEAATGNLAINLLKPRMVVRNNYIDLKGNLLELGGGTGHQAGLGTHIFEGNEVRGSGSSIFTADETASAILIRNNRFITTHTVPLATVAITVTDPSAIFEDNFIFIAKEGYVDGGALDADTVFTMNGAKRVARNRWTTDLLAATGSSGTAHYNGVYGTGEVIDEEFAGTALGTADTFRPTLGSNFNTNKKFRLNIQGEWIDIILGADVTTNLDTVQDVTGLSFTPEANTSYEFAGKLLLRTADATVGARPNLSFPTGLTDGAAKLSAPSSVSAETIRNIGGTTTGGGSADIAAMPNNTESFLALFDGMLIAGAAPSGDFKVRFRSEVAGTNVTVRAGSILRYRRIS